MLYRTKSFPGYVSADRKAFTEFLKLQTGESGKLKESVELVMAGYLAKQADADGAWLPWVFSTYDNDRFDERVDPAGWELDRYKENPVVLWAHCHSIPAIGLADSLTATDKLAGRIKFNAKEIDEFGWSIGERVKAGVIRAGSVGMLVKEIEWIDHKKNPEEPCDLIIRKQELLEFSICNVPANPFALRDEDMQMQKRTGAPTARSVQGGYWPLSIIN
jgi:HK97 family phage prohead protease